MSSDPTSWNLEERLSLVLETLGKLPPDFRWSADPYLNKLRDESLRRGSSVEEIFNALGGQSFFNSVEVTIPSLRQALVAEQIARAGFLHGRKLVDPSIPGSRKTGGALIAIDAINRKYLPQLTGSLDRKVKTLYFCPGHLIPKMQSEAHLFLGDDRIIVPITQKNRERDIERASKDDVDLVLLSDSMCYQSLRPEKNDDLVNQYSFNKFISAMAEFKTVNDAANGLAKIIGKKSIFRNFMSKNPPKHEIVERIVTERIKGEQDSVMESLRKKVFPSDGLYYVILDEIHNIVSPDSARATTIEDFFRSSRWGVALTGTLIGNYVSNDRFLAYLLGIVGDPEHYNRLVTNDPQKVRMVFKPYTTFPIISDIRTIDPDIPETTRGFINYDPLEEIVRLHVELEDAKCFSVGEKVLISRYLLTNPEKVHPDNFIDPAEGTLWYRAESFFNDPERLDLLEKSIEKGSNRVKALKNYLIQTEPDEKALIFTVHTSLTTRYLQEELEKSGFKFEIIDKSVPTEVDENGLSERMIRWQRALYNPEMKGLIGSVGTCKEGLDGQMYSSIVYYESPTVWFEKKQGDGRGERSGQRNNLQIMEMMATGIPTDKIIHDFRSGKGMKPKEFYHGDDLDLKELESFLKKIAEDRIPQLAILKNLDSRGHLSLFFNSNVGIGSKGFYKSLTTHNNHVFMVERFNINYDSSHSANVGRMLHSIISEGIEILPEENSENNPEKISLEKLANKEFDEIIDLGSGCAVYSRASSKRTTCVDLSGRQMDYGREACEQKGINGNKYYLGSIHDLSSLVSLDNTEYDLFVPDKTYHNKEGINDNSLDLAVCSNAFYYLNQDERKDFFIEMKNKIKDQHYLVMVVPRSKISSECEEKFLQDIEESGFEIEKNLSGEYAALKSHDSETGRSARKSSFRSIVIIAKNNKYHQPNFSSDRDYFVLQNEYEVRDGNPNKRDIEHADDVTKSPKIICDSFYKARKLSYATKETEISTGIESDSNVVETPAIEPTSVYQRPDLKEGFTDALNAFSEVFGDD